LFYTVVYLFSAQNILLRKCLDFTKK